MRSRYEVEDRKNVYKSRDKRLLRRSGFVQNLVRRRRDHLDIFGNERPPSIYLMNSGLISLASTLRMRACSSMSDHSAIKKKRCGSWVSRHSTPSFTCARDLCMGLPSE